MRFDFDTLNDDKSLENRLEVLLDFSCSHLLFKDDLFIIFNTKHK